MNKGTKTKLPKLSRHGENEVADAINKKKILQCNRLITEQRVAINRGDRNLTLNDWYGTEFSFWPVVKNGSI